MDETHDSHISPPAAWSDLAAQSEHLGGRAEVRRYLEANCDDWSEDIHVLYVTEEMKLLAAVRRRALPNAHPGAEELLGPGKRVGAAGFIIARTTAHPSYHPDQQTLSLISRLRNLSAELDVPLLDYLVFTRSETMSLGGP